MVEVAVGPYRLHERDFAHAIGAARRSAWDRTLDWGLVGLTFLICATVYVAAFAWLMISIVPDEWPDDLRTAINGVSGGAFSALFVNFVPSALRRLRYERLMATNCDYIVALDERNLCLRSYVSTYATPWSAIARIADKSGDLFFFLNDIAAVIVPRIAFASRADADAFLAFAQSQWRAARNSAANAPQPAPSAP